MTPDHELLRRFAEQGDETAFAEVVHRKVNWVYSTALRLTAGDAHLAEDVAQVVFTDLARKAGTLSRHPALGGWLHIATRYAAAKAVARESARRVREQEAFAMQTISAPPEIPWEQIRPILDQAIGQLNAIEREMVVQRFFEGKSHREVGDALGLSEDTARKRVERAVDKMRAYFNRRGVAVSAGLLMEAVDAFSVQAAPAELAGRLTTAAMAGAAPVAGGLAFLLKSFFCMTTSTKIITATVAIVIAVVSYRYLAPRPDVNTARAGVQARPPTPAFQAQVAPPSQPPAPVKSAVATPAPGPTSEPPAVSPAVSTQNQIDPNMQQALAMMATMKQAFNDMAVALTETNDPDTALQKINEVEWQFDDLQAKIAGTPLEQQVAPALKPLKAIQEALLHGDITGARKILQSLNSKGPQIQAKIETTAGMTIDQAAKNESQGQAPATN